MFRTIATAVITAILTSAFWIFAYNTGAIPTAAERKVQPAGDVAVIDPKAGPPVAVAEGLEVGPAGLAIPIAGVKAKQLTDTFTQARAGGARVHDAIDIMADEGTPVIAATDGTVEKLFYSDGGGGNTIYIRSPDQRWTYYYAHLQGYAPGLEEGERVRRGQRIGFVGSTGNADPAAPHLHFAIMRTSPGANWWESSTPVNPYPVLGGR